jgi:hypothetical protein
MNSVRYNAHDFFTKYFMKKVQSRTVVYVLGIVAVALLVLEARTLYEFEMGVSPSQDMSSSSAFSFQSSVERKANIVVTAPLKNEEITSPVIIQGEARVFENAFSYRVRDGSGKILVEGHAMTKAPDVGVFGPFEVDVSFGVPKTTKGTIEVFVYSAKDGEQVDTVTIPVRFAAVQSMEVKTFFMKRNAAPGKECEASAFIMKKVPKTSSPGKVALQELLQGPGDQNDLLSSIPMGTRLQSLVITKGVAPADFSEELQQYGGGSCMIRAIRSQIEKTLLQFSTIKSVIISVNGKTEDILQP